MAAALALFLSGLFTPGCTSVEADLVYELSTIPGVTMQAAFYADRIDVAVYNGTLEPIRIRWSQSSYVNTDGHSERLVLLEPSDTDQDGQPLDEVVPSYARSDTPVAPASTIDSLTGGVHISLGPEGEEVRLVVAIEHDGTIDYLDHLYRFVEGD
jgi:hypothetical protein